LLAVVIFFKHVRPTHEWPARSTRMACKQILSKTLTLHMIFVPSAVQNGSASLARSGMSVSYILA